ncbi:MAG: RNA 2',3'-cyclic phosphodiesterase [Thermoplasmata archaeon]|nr:RNA 2',3'-cyclic phosphodiesterase [Thermoplasmata archaeon]
MTFRAFLSIDVQPSEPMSSFHQALKETNAQVKLVDLENTHLTLKFLGDTSENHVPEIVKIMEDSIEGMDPFSISFRGTGAFPSLNHMKVVWIGVWNTDGMKSISDFLNDGFTVLGYRKEKRRFSPHLTLGRVKGGRNKEQLAQVIRNWKDEDFGEMEVTGIQLKKSVLSPQGPTYSTVHEAKIGSP